MKKEIEQYIDGILLQLKDFYGSHNDWEHFGLVLKPELEKLAEQAFWRGQEDVIKTEKQAIKMEKELIMQKEYIYPDSYAYVIRDKEGKFILSAWSKGEAERKLLELTKKKSFPTPRQEGQPTSRLTSLAVKISKIVQKK